MKLKRIKKKIHLPLKGKIIFLLASIMVLWVFVVFLDRITIHSKNGEFCSTCHAMKIHYKEFNNSKHFNEVKNCIACHGEKGGRGYLNMKWRSIKDVYFHFTHDYGDGKGIRISAEKLRLVNENCLECHLVEKEGMEDHFDLKLIVKSKDKNGRLQVLKCTDCHVGIVHRKERWEKYKPHIREKLPPTKSFSSMDCILCHSKVMPKVILNWAKGAHARDGISCNNCHGKDHRLFLVFKGKVAQKICETCHKDEDEKFFKDVKKLPHLEPKE